MDLVEIDAASNRGIARHPGAPRPDPLRPDGSATQGLHPRRGPPDHEGRLERAPEVARGAAGLRRLHLRLDPSPGVPAGDPVASPALRRPPPHDRGDRGQARADPRGGGRRRRAGCRPPDRPAGRGRHARRRVDARPGPRRQPGRPIDEPAVRDLLGLADADAVARPGRGPGRRSSRPPGSPSSTRSTSAAATWPWSSTRSSTSSAPRSARRSTRGDSARAGALAAAAHRLAAIDPERRGVGGLRFQLELALLDAATRPSAVPVMSIPATHLPAPTQSGPDPRAAAARPAPESPAVEPPKPAARPRAAAPASRDAAAGGPRTRPRRRRPKPPGRSHPPPPTVPPQPSRPPQPPGSNVRPRSPRPTAPAAVAAVADDTAAIDRLRSAWPEVVAVLSQSPPVKPLIAACRPVSVDGAVVTLGFPEDQAFLKDALERRRPMLEDGIGRVLGRAGQRPLRRDEPRARPGRSRRRTRRPT